jgi:hypothetical protein
MKLAANCSAWLFGPETRGGVERGLVSNEIILRDGLLATSLKRAAPRTSNWCLRLAPAVYAERVDLAEKLAKKRAR